MAHRVCPWWIGYCLTCPLRRYGQDPAKILAPYLREGMTVLEPGPGMGFFTLEMARQVGASGRVIAIDAQPKMIDRLRRRAEKAGLLARIRTRVAGVDRAAVSEWQGQVDFSLLFAMVHEVPDVPEFFAAIAAASKTGARVLLAEPRGHVDEADFSAELVAAEAAGFRVEGGPRIRRSLTAMLELR